MDHFESFHVHLSLHGRWGSVGLDERLRIVSEITRRQVVRVTNSCSFLLCCRILGILICRFYAGVGYAPFRTVLITTFFRSYEKE